MSRGYVSVSGVTTRTEAEAVIAACPSSLRPWLVLGLLCSAKSLTGGDLSPRSVLPAEAPGIAALRGDGCGPDIWPHYYSPTPQGLRDQLLRVRSLVGGRRFSGCQLNLPFVLGDPESRTLAAFRQSAANADGALPDIVLQLGPRVLDQLGWHPMRVFWCAASLSRAGAISAVLLDASAGTGTPLDVGRLYPLVEALDPIPGLGVGVAGGLGPGSLSSLRPLFEACSRLSVDAESSLRSGADRLDIGLVKAWLEACERRRP